MHNRWLKSPDVKYTQPLDDFTAAQSTDAEKKNTPAPTGDKCVQPAIVDELQAQIAELERKLRELQLRGVAHENVSSGSDMSD